MTRGGKQSGNRLPKAGYEWALRHLQLERDTDFFPAPFEVDALSFQKRAVVDVLGRQDIGTYKWKKGRRFVVPKAVDSFRAATQLDPVDSLVLAALVKTFGKKMEQARVPESEKRVFSYRFDPTSWGQLYGRDSNWRAFWETCRGKARKGWVAIADVADYYNQIYHHTLENQLTDSGVQPWATRSILRFLQANTEKVSRGVPVGPHATHLLAELAFNPIDRALLANGLDYCRFIDDVHFFCESEEDARIALSRYARILDEQQRLTLQDGKTRIVTADEYQHLADGMLLNQPFNDSEVEILDRVLDLTGGEYHRASLSGLTADDLSCFDEETLEGLFELYLNEDPVPFPRLGWLLRRLSQVGPPGAFSYVLRNLAHFQPILGDTMRYLLSASENFEGDWGEAAELILEALATAIVRSNEYVQMILLHLFAAVPDLDHIDEVTAMYSRTPKAGQREIVCAACVAGAASWLRPLKGELDLTDPWQRRAILRMAQVLPGDEGGVWRRALLRSEAGLDLCVLQWSANVKLDTGALKALG